jgi:hypothetical protein
MSIELSSYDLFGVVVRALNVKLKIMKFES